MYECRVCKNVQGNSLFMAREMLYGTREQFEYFECANCGCLQITTIPTDISKYYPRGYYSQTVPNPHSANFIKAFLKRKRSQQWLGQDSMVGRLLIKGKNTPNFLEWARNSRLHLEDAILDVGSGAGHLLLNMYNEGFQNLTGVDPYNEKDILYSNSVRVLKMELSEIDGVYDFVMLHHSFEHMTDPLHALREIHRVLKHNRYALLRVPVASYAWKTYGADWVQLDAPRHLYSHTERSINILAKEAGFEIARVDYDSGPFQFWGSIQYQKDIPLNDPRSFMDPTTFVINPDQSLFTQADISSFEAQAIALNESGHGDQACFYLFKPEQVY